MKTSRPFYSFFFSTLFCVVIWAALGAVILDSCHAASGNTNTPEDLYVLTHDANAVAMAITNTGQIALDLYTGNGQGTWPGGTANNYIFGMGVWIGGIADLDGDGTKDTVTVEAYNTRSGGTEHAEGRVGQDTSDPLARVFSSTIIEDLIDWPVEFRDPQGDPIVYSSQDFVTIYNDISGEPSYEAGRCGIEIKQRSMAFVGGLNFNTILVFYEITNRSDSLPDGPYTLEEASIAFVSDMDIGDEYGEDMSSVLDSVDVYGRGTVGLNTGIAWDSDFNEDGWEGKVGFVGVHLLQPPGNHWDGIDNDGDGLVDESPFNGIDDDLDGIIDDIPDEVDTVDDFRYSWFASPSTAPPIADPITDSGCYRMMMCLTEDDCGEFDIASDIRFLISSGNFDLPPGESQIAGFAIVFANPVGDPDHLDLYGDPPRPDPQDSVLSVLVATILGTRDLYTSGFAVGIEDDYLTGDSPLPRSFSLAQNYPNPFNPMTTISFDITGQAGEKQQTILTVYDLRGRLVRTLIDSELNPGTHKVMWNGRNEQGQQVSSGIYLYILKAGDEVYTRKMIVVK